MARIDQALFTRLSTYAGLAALVGTRVYPLRLPESLVLPAVVYTRITGERESAIASDVGLAHGVWQFDAWAAKYDGARTVADEVLGALKRQEFTAASVDVLEALLEREHELYEPEARLYRVSMDLTVWYRE